MKSKSNTFLTAMMLIFSILLCIGIVMLFFGFKGMNDLRRKTSGYAQTTGTLIHYQPGNPAQHNVAKNEHSAATYFLVYEYTVDGQIYTATSDYSTAILPKLGTAKTIRYQPDDPSQAAIQGQNRYSVFLYVGAMFTLVPAVFLWALFAPGKEQSPQTAGLIFGLVSLFFSYGACYLVAGTPSPFGIAAYYRTSFTFPLVIPPLLFTAGLYLCGKNLLSLYRNHQ